MKVDFWNEEVARLEVPDELVGLNETEARVDGAVDDLHGQRLIGRQGLEVRKIRFDKDDAVVGVPSPEFHKVNGVSKTERRVTAKDDAGLPVFVGESFGVQTRKMLQPAVLGQVGVWKRLFRQVDFALLPLRQPNKKENNSRVNWVILGGRTNKR